MNTKEADLLGDSIFNLLESGNNELAYQKLSIILSQPVHFKFLDRIGKKTAAATFDRVNILLDRIAENKTEGGWVIIGSALGQQLKHDRPGVFLRCYRYILAGDVWYTTDILGERVPGPSLLDVFSISLDLLSPWRFDSNYWIRRSVGVACHFFAKRAHGRPEYEEKINTLLDFLDPMLEEKETVAIRGGVGWALKTIGRYYPHVLTDWMSKQINQKGRCPKTLMLRKAMMYLTEDQRNQISGNLGR